MYCVRFIDRARKSRIRGTSTQKVTSLFVLKPKSDSTFQTMEKMKKKTKLSLADILTQLTATKDGIYRI